MNVATLRLELRVADCLTLGQKRRRLRRIVGRLRRHFNVSVAEVGLWDAPGEAILGVRGRRRHPARGPRSPRPRRRRRGRPPPRRVDRNGPPGGLTPPCPRTESRAWPRRSARSSPRHPVRGRRPPRQGDHRPERRGHRRPPQRHRPRLDDGDRGRAEPSRCGACKHAAGFLQARVAARLQTRYTPALTFKQDESVKKSIEMSRLIDEAIASDRKPTPGVPEPSPRATPTSPRTRPRRRGRGRRRRRTEPPTCPSPDRSTTYPPSNVRTSWPHPARLNS